MVTQGVDEMIQTYCSHLMENLQQAFINDFQNGSLS